MRALFGLFSVLLITASFTYKSLEDSALSVESDIDGAWRSIAYDSVGNQLSMVSIIANGFISTSMFSAERKSFVGTWGGAMTRNGKEVTIKTEFNSLNPERVGTSDRKQIVVKDNQMFIDGAAVPWSRIDDGSPGDLHGAWFITGRKRNGELSHRKPGARRTMKILSGTRFQWIAFNDETKEFKGTGGGTYTTVDGVYTENIEFFSRDSSRVGASLEFQYSLQDGDWHHSGKSSKGKPIYEVWSLPAKAFAVD